MLLLPFAALAAEPDLSGVHLAVGGGVATRATPDEGALATVSPALRVHLGPAFLVEALASGGVIRQSDTFTLGLADGPRRRRSPPPSPRPRRPPAPSSPGRWP